MSDDDDLPPLARIRHYKTDPLEIKYDPYGDESGNATLFIRCALAPLSDLTLDLRVSWHHDRWEWWPDNRRVGVGSFSIGYELHPAAAVIHDDDIQF